MTRRRAFYTSGSGLLAAAATRLLFLETADHPAVPSLLEAFEKERTIRALATAIIGAEFDVPPFAFLEHITDVQGIVVGSMALDVSDPGTVTIVGSAADPWAHLQGSPTAVVSCGGDVTDSLWVEFGIVRAGAFRWLPASDRAGLAQTPILRPPAGASLPQSAESDATAGTSPPQADSIFAAAPKVEPDLDLDTTQRAEGLEGPNSIPLDQTSAESAQATADQASTREGTPGTADIWATTDLSDSEELDPDATIAVSSDEAPIDDALPEGAIESRVCLSCAELNPPAASRCRGCDGPLSAENSELRIGPRPPVGTIHLSGGQVELLDSDLLIGRNPTRDSLEPHQRAVIHGKGDRSVSRRHIELTLDGWDVYVSSLKQGDSAAVETVGGKIELLTPGIRHKLAIGDTVRYGRAWFRFDRSCQDSSTDQ